MSPTAPQKTTVKSLRNGLGVAAIAGLAFVGGTVAINPASAQTEVAAATDDANIEADATTTEADATEGRSHGRRGHKRGASLEVLTETLGLSEEDIRDARSEGQSVADIADANGVALDGVINALVTQKLERIAERADDLPEGKVLPTEDEVRERITARVNGERPERAEGEGREGRREARQARRAAAAAEADQS